jgi:hypothetical protein
MNPHAQSKDPYTPAGTSAASGSSPGIAGSGSHRRNSKRDATDYADSSSLLLRRFRDNMDDHGSNSMLLPALCDSSISSENVTLKGQR